MLCFVHRNIVQSVAAAVFALLLFNRLFLAVLGCFFFFVRSFCPHARSSHQEPTTRTAPKAGRGEDIEVCAAHWRPWRYGQAFDVISCILHVTPTLIHKRCTIRLLPPARFPRLFLGVSIKSSLRGLFRLHNLQPICSPSSPRVACHP